MNRVYAVQLRDFSRVADSMWMIIHMNVIMMYPKRR